MQREEVVAILSRHRDELKGLGIKSLAVFGSTARNEVRPDSDVDLLVEFDRGIGLFHLVDVQHRLSELLGGVPVDLVMRNSVLEELKEDIYGEAVSVLQAT
jgi:predicted nucleotidyltransferase